jgi:hypothetical protein
MRFVYVIVHGPERKQTVHWHPLKNLLDTKKVKQ